ncbi:LytTR family DNA-binding domain-containing protein [Sporosarcina sp. FSL K6-3457]|uniref:LytTR family DNA-binding domain-containing protein n=1 Tax=Sporosarcina sp. FSL K6-3457 TaxID=2978204 RepID=UPI0030FBBBB6
MSIIRVTINESKKYEEAEIIINCPHIDSQLERIIKQIHQISITLIGTREGRTYSLLVDDLYYIETIDNQTFIYTEIEVYACDLKLYEIEQKLSETHFIRVSKNLIVNTTHIDNVRALLNGKFEASLTNREKVIVNRHYVKAFKEKFLS